MPLTKFPNGISSMGVPVIGGQVLTTGTVFFVDSNTGSNGNSGVDKDHPFSTLAYAATRTTTGKGDVIIVMPGHVETVATAAGVSIANNNVTVLGLGNGDSRPQVNFTATASTFAVSGVDVRIENIRFTGGIDAVVTAVVVTGDNAQFINCVYEDVTGQCTAAFVFAACNDCVIDGLVYNGAVAAGTQAAIVLNLTDGMIIRNSIIDGNFSVGGIDCRTNASTDLQVYNIRFRTRNAADIFIVDTITASTGQIGPNLYLQLQDNAANITESITGATFVLFDNIYVVNLAGEKAMLINTTASTDA